ncbi:MAG: hypothetical protein MUP09_10870, partial [Thiovulaceae bacterium]|nr:hypothetical protein [Sulfurimonadaceae bacterium]
GGFGLWQALMMMLIVSGMMVVALKYARISAEHTTDTYLREQTELYMNSAIEMALLAISQHDRSTGGCLSNYSAPDVSMRGVTYSSDINITKYYLLKGGADSCSQTQWIGTEESHGMVMLEVEAKATSGSKTVVRILRRTLQRP